MNSVPDWAGMAGNWAQALQSSFGGLAHGMPSLPALPNAPQLGFDPAKLQALQKAYVQEAAQLWNNGLGANAASAVKRFASDAWSSNPVAAYGAALYLLNARTL